MNSFPSFPAIPPILTIWSYIRQDYQIYSVSEHGPAITLTPIYIPSSFCFAEGPGDTYSRRILVRRRFCRTIPLAIWHTGGWLCKKEGDQRTPVYPIFSVSDPKKLPWGKNGGLEPDLRFDMWVQFQTPFYTQSILKNCIDPRIPLPEPVPIYVAEALLERAQNQEELCPISLSPFKQGESLVTSCFHVFDLRTFLEWHSKNLSCPVCKKVCSITKC